MSTRSNLAYQKDVQKQILLFTEDATVEGITDGAPSWALKGRQQIGKAFVAYLASFETVYHMNGQQTVELRGAPTTWSEAPIAKPPSKDLGWTKGH